VTPRSHPVGPETATVSRIPDAPPGTRPNREQIEALAAFIAERFRPERIVLFGSRAYGEPGPDSDVDLMVIMETPGRPVEQAVRIRQAIDLEPSFSLDILVRTPRQIRVGLAEGDFFVQDVMTRGVTLYAADGDDLCTVNGVSGDGAAGGSPSLKQATRDWLQKAEADHRSARALRDLPDPLLETACFHAQQSVEKHLKAFLQEHGVRFPRTHNLAELAALVGARLPGLAALGPDLDWLTDYAVDIRYPGTVAGATESDRALAIADRVRALVLPALGLPVPAS
jgi:HEPN domain-containing protein/predicted nucleotidyltransferase